MKSLGCFLGQKTKVQAVPLYQWDTIAIASTEHEAIFTIAAPVWPAEIEGLSRFSVTFIMSRLISQSPKKPECGCIQVGFPLETVSVG